MKTHNPSNERIKHRYFVYLKECKGRSELTVDAVTRALSRFETYTKFRDFKAFHYQQAVAFKEHLTEQHSEVTGETLSKATLKDILSNLAQFFQWLAGESGFRSRLNASDAEYFKLSKKDSQVANARREKSVPTVKQIMAVIAKMPASSDIELRNRALVAITFLTGARDRAIASIKLKHIDLGERCIFQDAREVQTKFSKTFLTFFFPVGDEIRQIVVDWVTYLREEQRWSDDDPLFPSTNMVLGATKQFEVRGLKRKHWSTTAPIRKIFGEVFTKADLPYFNPHSFRDTLTHLGEILCQTPEQFKAWSQNLGHEGVLTTFCSYGEVPTRRQKEIIEQLGSPRASTNIDVGETLKVIERALREEQRKEGNRP